MRAKRKPDVLTTINDDVLSYLRQKGRKRVILAGEVEFISLQSSVPAGFLPLNPRTASAGADALLGKKVVKAYVSVDERLFDFSGVRFALAIDGYLAWGLRQRSKTPVILIGGGESAQATNLTIVVFDGRKVVHLDEKMLPESSATYFRDALAQVIAGLRMSYPAATFYQAAPLADLGIEGCRYIGDEPLKRLSYFTLERPRNHRSFLIPGVVAAVGVAFYGAAVMDGLKGYKSAVASYEKTIADPVIMEHGGIDAGLLGTLSARRAYMEQPRRQSALMDKAESIVRGIAAIPGAQIIEMKLPGPSADPGRQVGLTVDPQQAELRRQIGADRSADVWLSIAVPKAGASAIDQARATMLSIANNTGMSLRLVHQGWRDESSRRVFNIEGFIHD